MILPLHLYADGEGFSQSFPDDSALNCKRVMRRWTTQAVLEAVEDMNEEARIAVAVAKTFIMPDETPIKSVLPDRYFYSRFACS